MKEHFELVIFKVHRDVDGLYTATSPQLSGVFVAHRELGKIVGDMPNIIQLWYRRQKNLAVEVYSQTAKQEDDVSAFVAIPAEIAAKALAV